MLVASFIDLADQRRVTREEAQKLAESHRLPYMEMSAKTGQGVREVIEEAVTLGQIALGVVNNNQAEGDTPDKRCTLQ